MCASAFGHVAAADAAARRPPPAIAAATAAAGTPYNKETSRECKPLIHTTISQ